MFADTAPQTLGNSLEKIVADRMTECVVDALELVDVEIEHRQALVRPHARQRVAEEFLEVGAIGQIGERVVARHVGDAPFCLTAIRHVLVGRDPAAVGDRVNADGNRATIGQLGEPRRGFPAGDRRKDGFGDLLRLPAEHSNVRPGGKALEQRCARDTPRGGTRVHLVVSVVADHQAGIFVEHQQRVRHVVDRGVETEVLRFELGLSRFDRRRAFCGDVFELLAHPVPLLDRAASPLAIEVCRLVSLADEVGEPVDVDGSVGVFRGFDLLGEELVHRGGRVTAATAARRPASGFRERRGACIVRCSAAEKASSS